MKLVLGLDADGSVWPPTTDGSPAETGGLVVGPGGLLGIVETALGLGGPSEPQVVRLARWRARLTAADAPGRFWHASLRIDPFATARAVLGMRDALVEAGWQAGALAAPPPRLADLAAAEAAGPALPPGPADRLRAALAEFAGNPPPAPIAESLALLDARVLLPPGLGALVDALEASGTVLREAPLPCGSAGDDLGAVQACLSGGRAPVLTGDGSFALLTAQTEGAAAEVLADWLAAEPDRQGVVIVAARPTGVLDAALRRRHLPRLGVSAPSAQRGLLQVLPLALATRWQPFDAVRMLEWLQLPRCPVPAPVCQRLVGVLPDCPGRGGPEWNAAIAEGLAAYAGQLRAPGAARDEARIAAGEEAVRLWLAAPLADPRQGLRKDELFRLCASLAAWAGQFATQEVPLAASLASFASALLAAAEASGLERLSRLDVERLLDAVLAEGEADASAAAEAAEWSWTTSPGALWGAARTLVWWGFDPPALPARSPWDAAETAALKAAGCLPWTPTAALGAASAGWRRPLLGATGRVLLVAQPGPEENFHPLAHEMAALLEACPACRPAAESLIGAGGARLAGRRLPRVAVAPAGLPVASAAWRIPCGFKPARAHYSGSSLERLIGCPFAWVLGGEAGLHGGRHAGIAEGERLIGQLAQRLVGELFPPGVPGDPAELARAARARLPALVEQAAAPLLQPGAAADRARMEELLPAAMTSLAVLLAGAHLQVLETGAGRAAEDMPEPGECFHGRIGLLAADRVGEPVAIDLKWTRSPYRYTDELAGGRAIRLAAAARLAGAGERAACFLLRNGEAVCSPHTRLGMPVRAPAPTLEETWKQALIARKLRLRTLGAGTLRALGVDYDEEAPDPDGVPLPPEPPCRYCDFGRLCGREATL